MECEAGLRAGFLPDSEQGASLPVFFCKPWRPLVRVGPTNEGWIPMKLIRQSLAGLVLAGAMMGAWSGQAAGKAEESEVLVRVANDTVTAADLEQAVKSSPFATQFNTLEEDEQAALRGDLLKRLVAFRLLRLEAHARGLDQSDAYRSEEEEYRIAQLYRFYTDKLREQLSLSPEDEARLKQRYRGQADALAAARASELVTQYRELKLLTVRMLRDRLKVVFHEDRIQEGITPDTLLMEGDGVQIRYGDLVKVGQFERMPEKEWIEERLYKRAELLLFARAAEQEGVDIEARMAAYRRERLPALLIE